MHPGSDYAFLTQITRVSQKLLILIAINVFCGINARGMYIFCNFAGV